MPENMPAWLRDADMPAWLTAKTRGGDQPEWLRRKLAANGRRGDAGRKALADLEEAVAQLEEQRAARARRHAAEQAAGEAAWERAMLERYGRVPVAASSRWWGARPPVSIW